MQIFEIPKGSKVLIKLHRNYPANSIRVGNVEIYKTGKKYANKKNLAFVEGEGNILLNENNMLVLQFVGRTNPSFSGIAEIDYYAVQSLYLYEGESNVSTVSEGLEKPALTPPMEIYRKRITLRWPD